MAREPEKVIIDGKVAVLISPGWGAGWSTWADAESVKLALFDRRFVQAAEAGVTDIGPVAKEVMGNEYFYCGGWRDIEIVWLPVGTAFTVEEHDGNERLITGGNLAFVA